ncbi:MAG: alpha/beta hydrolase [Actinobacteria bacterium]|nr:alpha/beta hydrolase [Actinomycetota bacterium]
MDVTSVARFAGRSAVALGAVALGAVAGAVADRVITRAAPDPNAREDDFHTVPDRVMSVLADDGTYLHVEIDEATEGAEDITMVFAHGYALTLNSWYFQRASLRGRARLVFYDQRSHGRSARAEFDTHHVDQLGRDLASVIAATAPRGTLILVGHSMGGMTVMAYVSQNPEQVGTRTRGIALIATTAGGLHTNTLGLPGPLGRAFQAWVPNVAGLIASRRQWFDRLQWSTSDIGILVTQLYSFGSATPGRLGRFVADMVGGTPIDVVAEFLPALQDHDKRDALPLMAGAELLVVCADRDRLTPKSSSEEIVAILPHAEFAVIEGAGHMVQLERPGEVNVLLRGLLQRVRALVTA